MVLWKLQLTTVITCFPLNSLLIQCLSEPIGHEVLQRQTGHPWCVQDIECTNSDIDYTKHKSWQDWWYQCMKSWTQWGCRVKRLEPNRHHHCKEEWCCKHESTCSSTVPYSNRMLSGPIIEEIYRHKQRFTCIYSYFILMIVYDLC